MAAMRVNPTRLELTRLKKRLATADVYKRQALEDGFLYVGDGAEINCSLANVVNQRKAELEAEVCRILFQE